MLAAPKIRSEIAYNLMKAKLETDLRAAEKKKPAPHKLISDIFLPFKLHFMLQNVSEA